MNSDEEFTTENADGYSLASGKKKPVKKKKLLKRRKLLRAPSLKAPVKRLLKAPRSFIKKVKAKQLAQKKDIAQQVKAISKTPAIKMPAPVKAVKEKAMSTGVKVGLVATGLVVLGTLGFLIYKAVKK